MGFLYYYDYYFFILVIPAMLISLIAQVRVKSAYARYSKRMSSRGITGVHAAQSVLSFYGICDVHIEQVDGQLSDHYDPRIKTIRLSQGVFGSTSLAAIGIACHEAGHAAQHAENYAPISIRNKILPVCNIGSSLGLPLAFAGYFFGFEPLITIGLLLYSLIAVFQIITLPVEFNASRRAIKVIEETHLLDDDEVGGAKSVLTAAAMTYVAALLVAIANILRFVLRFRGRSNG